MSFRPATALVALPLIGCGNASQTPPADDPPWLTVLSVNVGNLDEVVDGPCGVAPYRGGLCSIAQEKVIAEQIAARRPDIAIITEIVDAARCEPDTWSGDPDSVCSGAPDRTPKEQVRRLVGDDYTISCAASHATCIAARTDRVVLDSCDAGALCLDGNDSAPHPSECSTMTGGVLGEGTSVSAAGATVDGEVFTVIAIHALNAVKQEHDPCRLAQFKLALETLPAAGASLIAGDWNMDAYRAPDAFASGIYWHTQVGPSARFTAHNVPTAAAAAAEDGSLPLPTWVGTATLDYVLSDFLRGSCQVLGESENTTRIDGEQLATMDHRAVWCHLDR
jgi:hypothetical protein